MEETKIEPQDLWYLSVPIPAYCWKKEGDDFILTSSNQAGEAITRGEIKNIIGIKLSDLYRDQPQIIEDIHRSFKENIQIKKEMWYDMRSSSTKKYLIIQYTPVKPDMLIVYTEDHTEKKIAEENLLRTSKWLSEAQKTAGLGYWSFDYANEKYIWSDQMYAIFEMEPGEVEPGSESFLELLVEEDRPRFLENFESAVTKGAVSDIDLSVRTASGKIRRIRTKTKLFFMPDGTSIPDFGIVWDITDNYENIAALKEARDIALKANEAKTDFISKMSHELRTPLNAIIGFSELLKYSSNNNSMAEGDTDNINEIHKAGLHLLGLINDVLDISRVETGRINFYFVDINIVEILQNCLSLVKTQMQKNNISLINNFNGAHVPVWTDPVRIKQIFINILSNAVKYNRPSGSITISILKTEDCRVGVSFTDTGFGIAEEDRIKIFNPFERLHINEEIEGAGIGLGICKKLAEQMSCSIELESEMNAGSTFTIYIPEKEF